MAKRQTSVYKQQTSFIIIIKLYWNEKMKTYRCFGEHKYHLFNIWNKYKYQNIILQIKYGKLVLNWHEYSDAKLVVLNTDLEKLKGDAMSVFHGSCICTRFVNLRRFVVIFVKHGPCSYICTRFISHWRFILFYSCLVTKTHAPFWFLSKASGTPLSSLRKIS